MREALEALAQRLEREAAKDRAEALSLQPSAYARYQADGRADGLEHAAGLVRELAAGEPT